MSDSNIIRIPPFHYIHVLDNNTNLTTVVEGPQTFVRKEHEQVVVGPAKMIKIPPMSYCSIKNPVIRNEDGSVKFHTNRMPRFKQSEIEIRFSETFPEPFPLYPYEELDGKIEKIPVVQQDQALKIVATRDFVDNEGNERLAGDEWLFKGPSSYRPRVEERIDSTISAAIIKPNTAIKLRAIRDSREGAPVKRKAGEEWLIRETGSYLPDVDVEIVEYVKAIVLTEKIALQLKSLGNFVDVYGKPRHAGEEWLVTQELSDTHIPDVFEQVVKTVNAIVLNNRQYVNILDPVNESGKNAFGSKKQVKGEATFFLKPNERLENGIQDVFVLSAEEALLLSAKEDIPESSTHSKHTAGDRWMIYGPCEYILPTNVSFLEKRKAIPLDEAEGIYVRNIKTGEVRAITGKTYMLEPHEELWQMELSQTVEELISRQITGETFQAPRPAPNDPRTSSASSAWRGDIAYESTGRKITRDKTRVVSFRVPDKSAVQVYDFKRKRSRVVFGPDLVLLQPDEQFTVISLSGGVPKRENCIQNLAMMLGPDFMTDLVVAETIDHARLNLKLAYNWQFEVDPEDPEQANKIFAVKDFVGDACKTIASRVRGAAAAQTFEDFHRYSSDIIKAAVFGREGERIKTRLVFKANNLVITNVDIKSVEPVDEKTRESLQKTMTLAIEITTQTSKANAEHASRRKDQADRGALEKQKIIAAIESEKAQVSYLRLKAKSLEVEKSGQAVAEAKSKAQAEAIKWDSKVSEVENEVKAKRIEHETNLAMDKARQDAEIAHKRALVELEISKARQLAEIETTKFQQVIESVGRETIVSMAKAGPEFQNRMMKGLGLKGFMIMNSKNPINLFNTASGFMPQQK